MTEKLSVTDEQLKELQQKYGRVVKVPSPAGDLVFRAPTSAEESAFQAARFGGTGHAGMAWRNLMVTLVVSPEQPRFLEVLKEWPALNINPKLTDALRVLRGDANEDEVK